MEVGYQSEAANIAIEGRLDRGLPFYSVSTAKLSLLSLSTFGLYPVFWFYKNWVRIRESSEPGIRPFWRAFFAPWFCRRLVTAVNDAAEPLQLPSLPSSIIAGGYLGFLLLERLPDPYWMLSIFSFIPLLAVQRKIAAIHSAIRPGPESMEGWSLRSFLALVVGGGVTAALVVSDLNGPPDRALRASEIPPSYVETLVDAGVQGAGEELEFFYSGGLYSILEDGSLLTNNRVIRYATLDGELYVASASYEEIAHIDVEYAGSVLEDTTIRVTTNFGVSVFLHVSSEEGRDREFVSELQARAGP